MEKRDGGNRRGGWMRGEDEERRPLSTPLSHRGEGGRNGRVRGVGFRDVRGERLSREGEAPPDP